MPPPLSVYVIDDDTCVAAALSVALRDAGFEVNVASDLAIGLEAIRLDRPDIVITDLQMPGLADAESVAVLRRAFPKLPILAMSGGDDAISDLARTLGADAFLRKPSRLQAITTCILRLVSPEALCSGGDLVLATPAPAADRGIKKVTRGSPP